MQVILLHVHQVVSDQQLHGLHVVFVLVTALNQASVIGRVTEAVKTGRPWAGPTYRTLTLQRLQSGSPHIFKDKNPKNMFSYMTG